MISEEDTAQSSISVLEHEIFYMTKANLNFTQVPVTSIP